MIATSEIERLLAQIDSGEWGISGREKEIVRAALVSFLEEDDEH